MTDVNDVLRLSVFIPTARAQWGPGADPRELIGFGGRAEELGYDALFVNDTLLTPRIEALTMLAALAPVTSHVTLGTGALLPVLRRPIQTAQALASIDLLSGGRLVVAVGAGFPGRFGRPLFDLSEVPWERRFTRLDETVALWRRIWSADGTSPVSFRGEVLRFDDIPPSITPARRGGPPIWLCGATPAALARTGRLYDGWLPYPPDPAGYRTGLHAIRTAATRAGRDPDAVTAALFVSVLVADSIEAGRERIDAYARANYGLPLEDLETIQAVVAGPRAHVVDQLNRYVDAGARQLVTRIGALDLATQRQQLEQVAALRPRLG